MYISSRVRASLQRVLRLEQHKKFWELACRLRDGRFEIPGMNVEKLHGAAGSNKLYSARLSRDLRIIFSIDSSEQNRSIIIQELNHHDAAYDRADRLANRQALVVSNFENVDDQLAQSDEELAHLQSHQENIEELTERSGGNAESMQLFKVPDYLLADPSKYIQFERNLDRYLLLTEEQEEILSINDRALLIQGPAGSGKTTLALFQALNLFELHSDDSIVLFTYHEELACVCRAYKVNLLGSDDLKELGEDDDTRGIKVFSYLEFVKEYLQKDYKKIEPRKSWISKKHSIDLIQRILTQKNRWERKFSADEIYGLIYSILKGRFVPRSDRLPASKDDYVRIFKDYGRAPEDLDEILEIFSIYQNRLEVHKQLDEADIIRLSYEQLKSRPGFSDTQQKLWIIIDEVQDFTELEWKSILLLWEKQLGDGLVGESYPFVCGDTNQNISRSGFRWQELESYLRSTLGNLHRHNAIKRIALHQNYRNTQQIHQLAAFVRRFGSDSGDLGLPSQITGPEPILAAVTDDQEMIAELRKIDATHSSMNPVVVLVEDDQSLIKMREQLADCANVFLLSLRNSKGLEFEDVIIYRAFSSAATVDDQSNGQTARLFDLWYMGICRARRNLLLVLRTDDLQAWQSLLQDRYEEFLSFFQVMSSDNFSLTPFMERRQLSVPDYNVIFLERRIAEDHWQIFVSYCQSKQSPSDNETSKDEKPHQFALFAKKKALTLWQRCLDYASLGRAYVYLKDYSRAIPLLIRSGQISEAAQCLFLSERYLESAELYEKSLAFLDAANAYAKNGSFEKAAEVYESIAQWKLAAENYKLAGRLSKATIAWEKAGMHEAAAEIYKSKGDHVAAAESFFQASDFASAAEMFLKADEKLEAARCFHKSGQYIRAIEIFLELNLRSEAAQSYEKCGNYLEAASSYEASEKLLDAARMHEMAQNYQRAADLYADLDETAKAAEAYEKSNMLHEAANFYERAGNFPKALSLAKESSNNLVAARCHERLGDFQSAASCFIAAGNINEAAYCLEKAGNLDEAAKLFTDSENYAQAASCLLKLDRKMEAAKLLILATQVAAAFELSVNQQNRVKNNSFFSELIQWCRENKRTNAEAQLFEMSKDFASAAQKYRDCLMLGKAAKCFEKAGKLLDAANAYSETAEFEKAAECYKSLKKWKDAAQCLERIQKWAEAKVLYEKANDKPGIARCVTALNWMS